MERRYRAGRSPASISAQPANIALVLFFNVSAARTSVRTKKIESRAGTLKNPTRPRKLPCPTGDGQGRRYTDCSHGHPGNRSGGKAAIENQDILRTEDPHTQGRRLADVKHGNGSLQIPCGRSKDTAHRIIRRRNHGQKKVPVHFLASFVVSARAADTNENAARHTTPNMINRLIFIFLLRFLFAC